MKLLKKLKELKEEVEEGISLTMHALHEMRDLPEGFFYSVRKKLLGPEQNNIQNDRMYNSDLIDIYDERLGKTRKMTEEEQAQMMGTNPALEHPTDFHKRDIKVAPGFSFQSAYGVPIDKKYKKKNPYKRED